MKNYSKMAAEIQNGRCFYYYMEYYVMGNLKFYVSWNCKS